MADVVLPDLRLALNPEQYRAATTVEGPLLVLAGAGSGKTRVLVHRIAYILAEKKAKPWQILAVTFTNKAAAEMRERLERLVGPLAKESWIGTFHALSARMLRIEGHRLGYHGGFSIYDADDSRRLLKSVMTEMDIDVSGYGVNVQKVGAEIDKAKNAGFSPETFADKVQPFDTPARKIAKAVYFRYQRALKKSNAMDFGDLVRLATDLLRTKPEAFQRFGRRFRFVMVDEFQDTNKIQYDLLRTLTRDHNNLMVVGDDDQAIYRWRGAKVDHILGFTDEYPSSNVVKLEQNYRSTGNILDAANAVIAHNRARHAKRLFTEASQGPKIGLALLEEGQQEARLVADLIRRSVDDGREPFEHAILFRMNAQSRLFEEALRKAKLPYRLVGGTGFFERMEVKDLLSYLRLLVNPTSRQDFMRVVNTPGRGIGAKSIERLRSVAETRGLEGLEMLSVSDGDLRSAGLGPSAIKKLRGFEAVMKELTAVAASASATEVAHQVVERTGYELHLRKHDLTTAEDRLANVGELISSIAEHEAEAASSETSEGPRWGLAGARTPLEAYLDQASLASGETSAGEPHGIQLLTLHSAKGLEFPFVFLVGLEEKTFPSARAVEGDDLEAMEEERRLCYVGMTRAREELAFTLARRRVIFGRTEIRPPSRFVGELPDDVVRSIRQAGIPTASTSSRRIHPGASRIDPFDDHFGEVEPGAGLDEVVIEIEASNTSAGGHVRHNTFGSGEVLAVEGRGPSARVRVRFADGKTKTVVSRFLTWGADERRQ